MIWSSCVPIADIAVSPSAAYAKRARLFGVAGKAKSSVAGGLYQALAETMQRSGYEPNPYADIPVAVAALFVRTYNG